MDWETVTESEVKSERETQILYDIAYIWNLKYDTENLSIRQKQIHRHSKQTCGFQESRRMDWEFGIVVLSHLSHVQLFATLWTVACQAPLCLGFSRWEYWSVLPCPPLVYLSNPGIESASHYVSFTGRQVLYHPTGLNCPIWQLLVQWSFWVLLKCGQLNWYAI